MTLLDHVERATEHVRQHAANPSELERRRLDRTLLELRERRLSFPAIATVLDLYEGVSMTPEQVRYRLAQLGAPKNANKARPRCAT